MSGTIEIRSTVYNLTVTANKRRAIYNNNIFNYTVPYNYDDIINNPLSLHTD